MKDLDLTKLTTTEEIDATTETARTELEALNEEKDDAKFLASFDAREELARHIRQLGEWRVRIAQREEEARLSALRAKYEADVAEASRVPATDAHAEEVAGIVKRLAAIVDEIEDDARKRKEAHRRAVAAAKLLDLNPHVPCMGDGVAYGAVNTRLVGVYAALAGNAPHLFQRYRMTIERLITPVHDMKQHRERDGGGRAIVEEQIG
jgi:hypothetical protein